MFVWDASVLCVWCLDVFRIVYCFVALGKIVIPLCRSEKQKYELVTMLGIVYRKWSCCGEVTVQYTCFVVAGCITLWSVCGWGHFWKWEW